MLKPDKIKDTKTKEKQDNTKSIQNILYLISPLDTETHKEFSSSIKAISSADLEKSQSIYQIENNPNIGFQFLRTPFNSYLNPETGIMHYRAPHSSTYFPPIGIEDGSSFGPSPLVRNIEEKGQLLFDEYTKMYYGEEGVISNFFVEENLDEFLFAFCVQKRFKEEDCEGIWNSTNVANIVGDPTKSFTYKVTTSVIYQLASTSTQSGLHPFTISGNLKRTVQTSLTQKTQQKKLTTQTQLDEVHLTSIGRLVQQNQSYLRQQMESVYALKTKQIIHKIRIADTKEYMESKRKNLKMLLEMNLGKKENLGEL